MRDDETVRALARASGVSEAALSVGTVRGKALSDATVRAYRRDWVEFAGWCRAQGVDAGLPVNPLVVAAYLASLADRLGRSALAGRLAAIGYQHRQQGVAWSAGHPAIQITLEEAGRAARPTVSPLGAADIGRLVASCEDDLAGLRDRALFLVGFAGAMRRAALVAIDFFDLTFEAGTVTIRAGERPIVLDRVRGKTGGPGEMCPVQALERWLARAKIRRGAVFRSVTSGGRLGDRLSADGVRHILLNRAQRAGIKAPDGERLSPTGWRSAR